MSIPKVAVLATGVTAAILAATVNPAPVAQAWPIMAGNCANCHAAGGSTTAAPSTLTPAAGATYTVAITLAANTAGGNSGYAIVPVTAGTGTTFDGDAGPDLGFTASMTAPTAAGTYAYNVFTNQGGGKPAGQASSATYSITVAPVVTIPPTTVPPTTVAPTTVAPTTVPPTTVAPTTVPPTTVAPTTVPPTTVAPTTVPPTTVAPTTVPPTTVPPTTVPPTTLPPTTTTTMTAVGADGNTLPDGSTLTAGDIVKVSGAGFAAGEVVPVVLESTPTVVATLTATPAGTLAYSFTVPSNLESGTHTLTMAGLNSAAVFSFLIEAAQATPPAVTPIASSGVIPAGAPDTGAGGASQPGGSPLTGLGGLALLLGGAAMVPAIRRRRRV